MPRSLLVRLLGLSLAVAVFAIAATAWLTTTGTTERLRGAFERTLEADSFVYQELLFYGQDNETWDDVATFVDDLAERTGRRVALTSPDGDVLADSSADGQGGAPLPSTPTAEIDPRIPQAMAGWTMSHVSTPSRGITSMASAAVPLSTWRLTDDEATSREILAREATVCAERIEGGADVMVDQEGALLRLSAGASASAPTKSPDDTDTPRDETVSITEVAPCIPEELEQPSEASMELNRREIDLATSCLDDAGVGYQEAVDQHGLTTLLPQVGEPTSDTWLDCTDEARTEAMEPFVADPALLYIGSTDRFDAFSGDGPVRTALTGLAVLAAAAGVTVLAGRRLTHPIRTLTAAAQQMGSGERGARVPVTGHDEVAQLGHAFNAMAESIEAGERQHKAMVGDVAHELRTPLANVRGYLEAAEDGVVPLDSALVESLLEESALLQRLIDDLQDLALADAGRLRMHPAPTEAAALARQVTSGHRAGAEQTGVTLTVDAPEPVVVDVDPARLRQALSNLVGNAVQYTPGGGHVRVTVTRAGDDVVLSVDDDGPGIAAEHLPHLFDRFYRTDTSRTRATGGSGLGLAITKHLVEAHGGTVDVSSTEGVGSTFTIRIPVHVPVAAG